MSEPAEFKYLNMDDAPYTELEMPRIEGINSLNLMTYYFDLSQTI